MMIDGDLPPFNPGGIKRPVMRVKSGQRFRAVLLGDLVGKNCHYVEGRTKPCAGHGCTCCLTQTKRWYGWAPALIAVAIRKGRDSSGQSEWAYPSAVEAVLELTENAYATISGSEMRGLAIDLHRGGDSSRSALRVEFIPAHELKLRVPLPDAFDVKPILCRLWGIPDAFGPAPVKPGIAGHVETERRRRVVGGG